MRKRGPLKDAVVISIVLGTITAYVGAADFPSASELIDKYTRALDSTSSFIEDYEKTTHGSARTSRGSSKQKSYSRGQLRYDKQRVYEYEYRWGHWGPSTVTEDKPHYSIAVVNSEMKYQNIKGGGDKPGKVLWSPRPQDLNMTLGALFGVSYIGGYIGSYDERLDAILRKADRISVRRRTERVRGSRCFVIVADTKYGRYTVWLDTEHGFHPAKVLYKGGEGNYCYNHLMAKGDTACEYLKNVRFEEIDGLWVPVEADSGQDKRTAQGPFSKGKWHYKRTKIVLNPDHDKLGSFDDPLKNPSNDPELKNGTRVHIKDVPTKYTWQDGKVVDKNGREADINNPPAKTKIPKAEPKKELQSKAEDKDFSSDRSGAEPHENNTVAPPFTLTTIDGKDIRLEDYRGKVVILYFWATWCRPCVAGTPKLKKGYENLKASFEDDFEMISLSMDVNEESVREHVRKYELTWPQAHIGLHSKISSDYGVNNRAPKYFLIGPNGKLLLTPESPQVDTKPFIEKVLKNRKP